MKVFKSMKLNYLELKNRIIVSSMVTNDCTPDGMASEKFIANQEHKGEEKFGEANGFKNGYLGICEGFEAGLNV